MINNRLFLIILFSILLGEHSWLMAQEYKIITCKISYISNENVYVDKGKDSGLKVGDTLRVKRDGERIADLKILYTANHSASCEIVKINKTLRVGDISEYSKLISQENPSPVVVAANSQQQNKYQKKEKTRPFARTSGGLSFQWYHIEDQSGNNLNFNQPSIRFDLKAKELWGKEYYFGIKMRIRKNQRMRSYSKGISENEWRNRIYVFYFSYEDPGSILNYRLGRITTPNLRGIGYLDGGLIQLNINRNFSWGLYGGLQSSWQFETTEDSLQKYGLFLNFNSGDFNSNRFTGTIAYNSVFHNKTVSRKNVYIQSSFNDNKKLYIFQSMEIDINSSWRQEKEGKYVSLTSFYLSARYKFSNTVRSGISYDNRKNFYRYETRKIPEDLYDLAFRHGLSADISLTLPKEFYTSLRFGIKKRQDDSETVYFSRIGLTKRNLFTKYLTTNIYLNGYTNHYTKGWMPSLNILKSIPGGHYLSLNTGLNKYKSKFDGQDRSRYWLRLNGHFQLFSRFYISGFYSHEWGDDFRGYRILSEIGYRL